MQQRPLRKRFLFNLGIIIVICLVLYWLLFASLGWITHHGEAYKVPDFIGQSYVQAETELENAGFRIELDSTYNPSDKPLEVLRQQPDPGSLVKKGRTIFLTINKAAAPMIKMPNLVNLSFRSAEMLLSSNKLILGDTQKRPDLADGAVLAQLYKGQDIPAGADIAQGSSIDLVIGDGLGHTEFNVPDLTGMSYPEAVATLNASNLNYTVLFDGPIADTMSSVVYAQQPAPYNEELQQPNKISEGAVVDFRVKQAADIDH